MRKFISALFAGILCAACIVSCQKELNPDDGKFIPSGKTKSVMFTASFGAAASKVAIDDNRKVTWVAGDAISIFDGASNIKAMATEISADGVTAKFKVAIDENAKTVYAMYPYTEGASFTNSIISGIKNMGAAQKGEFGGEAPAYVVAAKASVSDKTLHFQHVSSLVKFTTENEGAQTVIFRGNNGEVVAGESAITFSDEGFVTNYTSTQTEITLDVNGAGTYYIATLPVTLSKGFKFIICDANGKHLKEKATMAPCEIRQGTIMNLDNVDSRLHDHHHITNTIEFEEFLAKAPTAAADDNEWWLDTDLDLTGITITPASKFAGKLYGQGYALLNWETDKPFITTLQAGGEVCDLIIDASCTLHPVPGTYSAFIVGSNAGTLTACENYASISETYNEGGQLIMGTICGRCTNQGKVESCYNYGNISISLTNPTKTQYVGGIVGSLNSPQSAQSVIRAKGCINAGNVKITQNITNAKFQTLYIGGITGASGVNSSSDASYGFTKDYGVISSCSNLGEVSINIPSGATGGYTNLGGIVGYFEGSVINCTNGSASNSTKGRVKLDMDFDSAIHCSRPAVGGIAGYVSRSLSGCNNYGIVFMEGFFGNAASVSSSGCGTFQSSCCGGIAGCAGDGSHSGGFVNQDFCEVYDCHNHGGVYAQTIMLDGNASTTGCGGVIGWSHSTITNCSNDGNVNISSDFYGANFGGVCGRADANMASCTNEGVVKVLHTPKTSQKGDDYLCNVGGVVGYSNASIRSCTTSSAASLDVEDTSMANTRVGGIAGMFSERSASDRVFTECTNNAAFTFRKTGDQEAILYYGGVVGYMPNAGIEITKLYNNGTLSVNMSASNGHSYVGGVVATTKSTAVRECENTGAITVDCGGSTTRVYVGGILGRNAVAAFDIENCTNRGNILIKNKLGNTIDDYCTAGGIYGGWEDKYNNKINNCYSFCDITSESKGAVRLGGIAGCLYGSITGPNVNTSPNYRGTITINGSESTNSEAGGVAGYFGGHISGITVHSDINSNIGYAAGMVGYYNFTGSSFDGRSFNSTIENNWITTTLRCGAMQAAGGFFGMAYDPTFNLNSCVVDASVSSGALGGMIGIAPANQNLNWGSKGGSIRTILSGGTCGLVCGTFAGTFKEDAYKNLTRTINMGNFSFNNCVINGINLYEYCAANGVGGLLTSSSKNNLWCADYKDSTQRYIALLWDRNHRINTENVIVYKNNESNGPYYSKNGAGTK